MAWVMALIVVGAEPTWTIGTDLRAEQRVGMLMQPGLLQPGTGAALELLPTLLLELRGPRMTFEADYVPRTFVRQQSGAGVSLLHQADLRLKHAATRRLALSASAGLQAGSLQYTQGLVSTSAVASRPLGLEVDMFGGRGQMGIVYQATRRLRWEARAEASYLGPALGASADPAGFAASYPPQYWLQGSLEAEISLDRLCRLALEGQGRRIEFIDSVAFDVVAAPVHWRCKGRRTRFSLTGGLALAHTPELALTWRALPVLGATLDVERIGDCTAGASAQVQPGHDPLRRNIGSRAAFSLSGNCTMRSYLASLTGQLSFPTPLELRDSPDTPAQDAWAGLRLAGGYRATDDTIFEIGTQLGWRAPPGAQIGGLGSILEVVGFVAARYAAGFGPGARD